MSAVPFKGSVAILDTVTGKTKQKTFAASDAANAFCTFDASGLTSLDIENESYLTDISELVGGTDTTKSSLFDAGVDMEYTFLNAAILASVVTPHVPVPIYLRRGAKLQIKQLA
jgi:hypothetical protein